MHELAITQSIVEIITRNAPEGARVTKAHLRLGKLTGFVPDSIRFYFEAITKGTPLEGVLLDFEEVPAVMACDKCGARIETNDPLAACPDCGGWLRVLSGRDLLVCSIDVETQ